MSHERFRWMTSSVLPWHVWFHSVQSFNQRIHPCGLLHWKNCGARQQFTLFAQDHRFDKGHCNDIKGEFGQILHTDTVVLPWLLQKFYCDLLPPQKKSQTPKKRNEKPWHTRTKKKQHPSLLQQKISPTIPPQSPGPIHGETKSAPRKASGFQLALVAFRIIPWYERKPKQSIVVFGKSLKNTIYLHWFLKKRGNSMTLHKLKASRDAFNHIGIPPPWVPRQHCL